MTTPDDLVSARYIYPRLYEGVAGTFSAIRERDYEMAARFGVQKFVRRAIKGEWPSSAIAYVVVSFGRDGYTKQPAAEVEPQVGKLGATVRPRRRATGRRR